MRTRIGFVVLAALLALPLAQITSPVEAKKRLRTVTASFDNDVSIAVPSSANLPSPVSASTYPSRIVVNGLKGTIRDVNLTLRNFGHDLPYDAQVLLVGPGGQTAIVMAGVGGADVVPSATLRLDDEAAAPIPVVGPLGSGTYRPRNIPGAAIDFNDPAPLPTSGNAALSVFDGANPNGDWRLFVQDAYGPTGDGYISAGWELEITTQFKTKKKKR